MGQRDRSNSDVLGKSGLHSYLRASDICYIMGYSRSKLSKLVLLLLFCPVISSFTQDNPSWQPLTERYTREQLFHRLGSPENWQLYPRATNREAWAKVPVYMQQRWIARGETALAHEWEPIPATIFLHYLRTGERKPYSTRSYERRIKLRQLVLAECFENKGRFLDQIANAIWAICEESFWGIPAHIGMQKAGIDLPDVSEPVVDLFAAETSEMLAWSVYLLKDQLDSISPQLYKRVKIETQRRILGPLLERDDFWWMGLDSTRVKVGNWNSWICSNWMATALLMVDEKDELTAHIFKILKVLDAYVSKNPADGASDEGPHYWGHAAGSLFDALELLYGATNGQFDIYDDPLITEMGRYINKMHISKLYSFNYGDALPRLTEANAFLVYHYGSRINDPSLMDLGAYLVPFGEYEQRAGTHDGMGRVLREVFLIEEMTARSQDHLFLRDSWMPVSQLMTARQQASSDKGFFLAAKAGHNAEGQGHNHNDVGNFIVYFNGKPVLIDIGMATYNAKTFGRERYTIWNNQSAYHNLPTINGVMQKNGREFKADNVKYLATNRRASLTMDISPAYPAEAGLEYWTRDIELDRKKGITISEQFQLVESSRDIRFSMMTTCKVDTSTPGRVEFWVDPQEDEKVTLVYNDEKLGIEIERMPLDTPHDPRIKQHWGDHILRILFLAKSKVREDQLEFYLRAGAE